MLSSRTLRVTVHSARDLLDVEKIGKNDPYVQLSLNLEDSGAFQKTEVKKNSGAQAAWNESFEFAIEDQTNLFIEVMDSEKGVDELIGFATIPLNQAPINGIFDIFSVTSQTAGVVHLTIGNAQGDPVPARSYATEEHLKRVKGLRNKGVAGDVAIGLAAAAAVAAGAAYAYNESQRGKSEAEEN